MRFQVLKTGQNYMLTSRVIAETVIYNIHIIYNLMDTHITTCDYRQLNVDLMCGHDVISCVTHAEIQVR